MGFREKLIIFGIIPWAILILLVIFIVLPMIGGTGEKATTLAEKETELASLTQSVASKKDTQSLKKSIAEMEKSLVGFNKEYPSKDNLEALYVDVQTALNDTNLAINKLAVSKASAVKFPKDFFEAKADDNEKAKDKKGKKKKKKKKKKKRRKGKKVEPVSVIKRSFKLDVSGDYQSLIDLLNYLQNYYRFITLENIAVKKKKVKFLDFNVTGSPDQLDSTIIFSVYTYNEVKVPVEETKKKKKKKKK